jgi:hypothetical protein
VFGNSDKAYLKFEQVLDNYTRSEDFFKKTCISYQTQSNYRSKLNALLLRQIFAPSTNVERFSFCEKQITSFNNNIQQNARDFYNFSFQKSLKLYSINQDWSVGDAHNTVKTIIDDRLNLKNCMNNSFIVGAFQKTKGSYLAHPLYHRV